MNQVTQVIFCGKIVIVQLICAYQSVSSVDARLQKSAILLRPDLKLPIQDSITTWIIGKLVCTSNSI